MKKKTIIITAAAAVLCVAVTAGIVKTVRSGGGSVEVTQVSYLNNGWWGSSTTSGGYITANASQNVYLASNSIVEKVYVKEGDKVKIGDTLLDYDKTLLELDLEEEKLNKQILELELKGAKNDLEKLKKTTPVADGAGDEGGYSPLDDIGGDEPDDDEDDPFDEASVVPNRMTLVAASADSAVETIGGGADGGSQVLEGQKVQAGESAPEAPESQNPADTPSTETQMPTEEQQPETQQTPETQQSPETEKQPEAEQPKPSSPEQDETEAPTDLIESPLSKTKAYKKLNFKTKYYKGSGTKKDPYIYLCADGAEIEASFMNMILGFCEDASSRKNGGVKKDGKGCYAVLEIREGDSLAGGFLKSITINGTIDADKPYAPDITWTFTSHGITKNVPDIPDEELDDPDYDDGGMWDFGDDSYTASELKEAIAEKEKEIKEMELDIREAEINVTQAQRKLDAATLKATINGVVKTVGDPKLGQVDDEPFMTITSNKGMYLKGSISEMDLESVSVGSMVSGMAQESGMNITAEITEISEYPSSGNGFYYGGESNPNASSYPFIAYIEDSDELINNEWVDVQIQNTDQEGGSVYLMKALIRSENGQSYVYKADENKKLVKQYVRTGKTLYSSFIEVKEGLTEEDWIAFPYGKNVKEGASVKELEGSGFADKLYY